MFKVIAVLINALLSGVTFALWAGTGFTSAIAAGCFMVVLSMFVVVLVDLYR